MQLSEIATNIARQLQYRAMIAREQYDSGVIGIIIPIATQEEIPNFEMGKFRVDIIRDKNCPKNRMFGFIRTFNRKVHDVMTKEEGIFEDHNAYFDTHPKLGHPVLVIKNENYSLKIEISGE